MNEKVIYINGKFLCQRITGVQRFALEIVKQLDNINPQSVKFKLICPSKEYIVTKLNLKNIDIYYLEGKPNYYWEQIKLGKFCKKNHPDDLLNMCNVAPVKYPGSCIVYDLGIIDAPQGFSWKQRFIYKIINKLNMRRYNHIFTDSYAVKQRIEEYYKVKNVNVIYAAADHMLDILPTKPKVDLPSEFYFCLGSMNPNKNFKAIIELAKNHPNDYFVISGKAAKSFTRENFEKLSNVLFAGYLSDSEISYLYGNCKAFLFPSLYEGFGIPPLEALVCGCKKVICNDIPVLREVYSDSVLWFKFDSNVIPLDDVSSTKVVDKYSWFKSANNILKVLI